MKCIRFFTLICLSALIGCQEIPDQVESSENQSINYSIRSEDDSYDLESWSPPGSETTTDGITTTIIPSEGWKYIGTDSYGEVMEFAAGAQKTVHCTCESECGAYKLTTQSGGVSTGCVGSCPECDKKKSVKINGIPIKHGGYFNAGLETVILSSGESGAGVFIELIEHNEFRLQFDAFIDLAYDGGEMPELNVNEEGCVIAPPGHQFLSVMILGRVSSILVPEGFALAEAGGGASVAECYCSKNGACETKTYKDNQKGTLILCTISQCTGTCSLSTSSIESPTGSSDSYTTNVKTYKF